MEEWIVCADRPTRAMERMRAGEVVRCVDCRFAAPCPVADSEKLICGLLDGMLVGRRDFCAWGETRGVE